MMVIIIMMVMRKIILKMNKKKRYILFFSMWRDSTIITFHLVLNVWMKLPVQWSILDNRFSELKKIDAKFLKLWMKNFKIWLLPLKETSFDALNTSDIHSNNLNVVSSKRAWFFQNRKIFSQKRRYCPLEMTAKGGLWYGLILYSQTWLYNPSSNTTNAESARTNSHTIVTV